MNIVWLYSELAFKPKMVAGWFINFIKYYQFFSLIRIFIYCVKFADNIMQIYYEFFVFLPTFSGLSTISIKPLLCKSFDNINVFLWRPDLN